MIYLTTDTHFFHYNIIRLQHRPLDYETKILRGLENIPKDSVLIHLGDFSLGHEREAMEKYIQPLSHLSKKILIRGNHDSKSRDWYMRNGFDFCCDEMMMVINNNRILFSHIPQPDLGHYDINVHGHCHSKKRTEEFGDIISPKQKLLTLEFTNYLPVNLESFLWKK